MLDANATEIIGGEIIVNGDVLQDQNTKRIYDLTHNYLVFVKRSADGWEFLYIDPLDRRYWEKTYPHSGMHGGGPPTLSVISSEEARTKYNLEE